MQLRDGENQIPVAAPHHIAAFDAELVEVGQSAVLVRLRMRVIQSKWPVPANRSALTSNPVREQQIQRRQKAVPT